MKEFPFSIYEFFDYFACGLILLLIGTYACDISWAVQQSATIQFIAVVVIAYTVGLVLAFLSGIVIEQFLVNYVLGRMDRLLLGLEPLSCTPCMIDKSGKKQRCRVEWGEPEVANVDKKEPKKIEDACVFEPRKKNKSESSKQPTSDSSKSPLIIVGQSPAFYKKCEIRTLRRVHWTRWFRNPIFRHAFEPLPPQTRKDIWDYAKAHKIKMERIQIEALRVAAADERTSAQRDTFLKMYGFARNSCMAFAVGFLALLAGRTYFGNPNAKGIFAGVCAFFAVVMFFQYLNFLRRYNLVVLNAYAKAVRPRAEEFNRRAESPIS